MTGWVLFFLGAMNALLLVSHVLLTSAMGKERQQALGGAMKVLEEQATRFSLERARLAGQVSLILDRIKTGQPTVGGGSSPEGADAGESQAAADIRAIFEREGFEKPNPLLLPLLSKEEIEDLETYCSQFPPVDLTGLREGDVDEIIAEGKLLPPGRVLGEEERDRLRRLGGLYQYYAKFAHIERYHTLVKPLIPRLKEAGAFVEFFGKDGPPKSEGPQVAHSQFIPEKPGHYRYYRFSKDDYPDIVHHKQVSRQRLVETTAEILGLLFDPSGDDP